MDTGTCAVCESRLPADPAITGADFLHGTEGVFTVHVCGECGAGNTRPLVGPEELAGYYPAAYGPHDPRARSSGGVGRALLRREARAGAARDLDARAARRLLDVGCGGGELGALMISRGWSVDGIEPSHEACERARAAGVDAREGTLDTVAPANGAYDAVIFNQSLEHVDEPVPALEKARDALVPGGVVLVSVPNFGSWARRRFGRHWFHLDLPRHRVHFTDGALRTALERAGLHARETWTSTSSSGLAGSVQYRRIGGLAVSEGAAREAIGSIAALALVPVALAEQALGGGRDFLHAAAAPA